MAEKSSKPRRSRKKAKVEVVADTPDVKEEEMLEEGFEKKRARNERGHYIADDPSTPENEAFVWSKPVEPVAELHSGSSYEAEIDEIIKEEVVKNVPEPLIVVPSTRVLEVETPKPETKTEPVSQFKSPTTYANPNGEYIANSFKRRRALRRKNR